jgi:hypothetical protein
MNDDPVCVCRSCAFVGPFRDALMHHQATTHVLEYRGHDVTRALQQAEECGLLRQWHDAAITRGRAWARDRGRC